MRILVSCPLSKRSGFTLIEVLVVLVITGLLAGVALPKLFQISQRYQMATERDSLLLEIGNLGYSAYSSGKATELGPVLNTTTGAYAVKVPPGWRIEMQAPIRYSFNGICSGGTLALQAPDGLREKYILVAPGCKPLLAP